MIKFAFDREDYMRNRPYPNLWHREVFLKYNHTNEEYNYNSNTQEFLLHTCHSELYHNLIKHPKDYVYLNGDIDILGFYFYPIELYGDHRNLIREDRISTTDKKYSTSFIKNIPFKAVQMAKWEKLKFVINYSHEPFSDLDFINRFHKDIQSIGLHPSHFIFFVGTSNLFELLPEIKDIGYTFLFEDSILISTAKKIKELQYRPNNTLGYETTIINENEIDVKRNKHFVCLNRNSQKPFRYTFGCFLESKNLWDKIYSSFLKKSENKALYKTGNEKFDLEILNAEELFANKIPIEVDTQNSEDKESFEVAKAFKKEIYLDSYIYIVTETNFEKDIFLTEKICNPMVVLQPFIVFGAHGYLKYLRSLGFETFDGFIDESYDDIQNNEERYLKLCNEVERISNLPLEELHNWYISIKEKLIHNRKHLISFADKTMFKNNLQKIEKEWVTRQMQIEGRKLL